MKRLTNPLGQYASQFKAFTREEEKDQFALYFQSNDEKIRQNIYNHSLRIIFILITYKHIYEINQEDLDDLIMVLAHHLWEIIPKYKMETGNRFYTFAQFCLYNRAKSYLKKMSKHNERFMYFDSDLSEDTQMEDGADMEKEAIIEEYGQENNIPHEVVENAILLLEEGQKGEKKKMNVGYGGRFTLYGDEVEFHFAKNNVQV
jgi:DNA-directed RNA polymerase specialized sigma subunit